MIGKKYGRLTIVKKSETKDKYECLCDCGNTAVVSIYKLRNGHTKSCGCFRKEVTAQRSSTHGHTKGGLTGTYRAWLAMRTRCNPDYDTPEYHCYAGRGITVCDRWIDSFENFLEDMGEKPSGKTIDRIDNDKGYSPDNCRWATKAEQDRNKQHNLLVEYQGETYALSQLARKVKMNRTTLKRRIFGKGMTAEDAITTPLKTCNHKEQSW